MDCCWPDVSLLAVVPLTMLPDPYEAYAREVARAWLEQQRDQLVIIRYAVLQERRNISSDADPCVLENDRKEMAARMMRRR